MSNPDWFELIIQWRTQKMGAYGVTLPFLVGALGYKAKAKTLGAYDVRVLFDEMVNHSVDGYFIEGRWCGDIDAPVFSVTKIDSPFKIQIKSSLPCSDGSGIALAFSPNLHSEYGGLGCSEVGECIEKLVGYAAQYVEKENFSRHYCAATKSYEYGPFSAIDINFITKTIMK